MLCLTLFVVNTPESTETLPCCNADASGTLTPLRLWRPSGLPTRARNHHRSRQAWSTVRFDGHLRPYLWPCAQLRATYKQRNERIRSGYIDFPHTVPLRKLKAKPRIKRKKKTERKRRHKSLGHSLAAWRTHRRRVDGHLLALRVRSVGHP